MIHLQEFKEHEVIIKENDVDEYLYLIKSGTVQVFKSINDEDVIISELKEGSFFGEMALIDERPRTATVIALEKTVLQVFHRDDFINIMNENKEITIKFLSGIFGRLRDANSKLNSSIKTKIIEINKAVNYKLIIEGLTEKAIHALPENPLNILVNQTPFNIGRESSDPFTNNSVELLDSKPLQISRNHLSFQIEKEKVVVYDIGSSLGLILNNNRIGGSTGLNGPLCLEDSNNVLIIGSGESDYKYKITQNKLL